MLNSDLGKIDLDVLFAQLAGIKRVGLSVSGGSDSLALMLLIAKWANRQITPPQIYVYSLDHGLRENSANEVVFVVDEANKLGFEVRSLNWLGEKPVFGLQEKAREARYKIISKAMAQDGVEILLTGHHAFDQGETILMRMAHSSGINGLSGMNKVSYIEGMKIYRPLLEISPKLLSEIVLKAGLVPVNDPSNEDEKYERVRWRKILPTLANLGLDEMRFSNFSRRLRRANVALDLFSEEQFKTIANIDEFGVLRFDRNEFLKNQEEIKIRILQKSLNYIGAQEKPFALAQVEQLLNNLENSNIIKQTLHGCYICGTKKHIEIIREAAKLPIKEFLVKSGEQILWDNRFFISNVSNKNEIKVCSAIHLTKKEIKLVLRKNSVIMAHIKTAPLVKGYEGNIIAIGTFVLDKNSVKISHNINIELQ